MSDRRDFRVGMKKGLSIADRLLRLCDHSGGPDAHWLWLGAVDKRGYGKFNSPHGCRAHRASYVTFVGELPEGYEVCHKRECNTPGCINPKHLYAGTRKENMQDAVALGWKPTPRFKTGLENTNGKLSPKQIVEIHDLVKSGDLCIGQGNRSGRITCGELGKNL